MREEEAPVGVLVLRVQPLDRARGLSIRVTATTDVQRPGFGGERWFHDPELALEAVRLFLDEFRVAP